MYRTSRNVVRSLSIIPCRKSLVCTDAQTGVRLLFFTCNRIMLSRDEISYIYIIEAIFYDGLEKPLSKMFLNKIFFITMIKLHYVMFFCEVG